MSREAVNLSDTLFALTTGTLPSGVAILKLSGSKAFEIAQNLFEPFEKKAGVTFGKFKNTEGLFVDEGLLLSFLSPNSHTGEDIVEFHLHGSKAIVNAMESSIENLGGRRATPGEFSYRAFLNGKTTLEGLEDLGDLFGAQEEESLKRIYSRREGSLERKVSDLKNHLIKVQAILDTAVDFADEYSAVTQTASTPLSLVTHEVSEIIQRYSTLKSGLELPKLVIAGRPNAGKSSLFNSLLCRYRAIVHAQPGTTRDVIEEEIQLGGQKWKLVDTAGVRRTEVGAEQQGIEMGETYLSSARYWLLVVDGTLGLSEADLQLLEKYHSIPHRIVWNKMDQREWSLPKEGWLLKETTPLSAENGEGLLNLLREIEAQTKSQPLQREIPTPTRIQAIRLSEVSKKLAILQTALAQGEPPEYLAEMNRQSIQLLESVIGQVDVEDVLDRVFSEFCIGK